MPSECDVEYSVITTTVRDEKGKLVLTYGIRSCCKNEGVTQVEDVFLSLSATAELCARLIKEKCCCIHLFNVCEDFAAFAPQFAE